MDALQRYLPIVVVIVLAFLVNPFQAEAQNFPQAIPLQFNYQSGNINDVYTDNRVTQTSSPLHFNGFWLLVILAFPAAYFVWKKIEDVATNYREPIGRGYSITYQDIRPLKKRTFKTVRKPRIL